MLLEDSGLASASKKYVILLVTPTFVIDVEKALRQHSIEYGSAGVIRTSSQFKKRSTLFLALTRSTRQSQHYGPEV